MVWTYLKKWFGLVHHFYRFVFIFAKVYLFSNWIRMFVFIFPSFSENQSFSRYEWNLSQRFTGQKHEPHAKDVPQGLQHFSQNLVPSCWVSVWFTWRIRHSAQNIVPLIIPYKKHQLQKWIYASSLKIFEYWQNIFIFNFK